ncbi:GNAT family N-acetyltransferase [Oxalobacter aliiformigenes]|uniref:GNAT family N-acetyltransferase n=1 Tax=Oxalobacter aliiformigenes TaxID=2946593 RepID=UPI0022B01CA8|nr:GNAT family N-acetyltransferase [Oxalobacter aliiformigenes]MCZ4064691.1 GNAT family N-acetyltransferase [Oxalobacter aliiformigenes]WAV99925.1 GNAT family N-acetyltransferase [Oxalobacter aliiformigenes]
MPDNMILSTSRILLRPWKETDYSVFFEMSSDPLVSEYLPSFPDKSSCDAFINHLRGNFSEKGWGFWALEHRESGTFMGMAGIHEPGPEFGVGRPCVEIGWRLARGFWGKGYAMEAAQEIVRFAFSELHLDELVSFTARDNVRSEKLMKRLGMIYEKDFDLLLFPPEHPHRRHLLYKLTRQQWQTRIGLHPVP